MNNKTRFLLTIILFLCKFRRIKTNESLSLENVDISSFLLFECKDSIIDCSNNGECDIDKKDCKCFKGYSTYFNNYKDHFNQSPRCNYRNKKQLYALFFAIFFSFGVLHFYLENYFIGYLQLSIFLMIFLTNSFIIIRLSLKHLKNSNYANFLSGTLLQLLIIMFLSFVLILWYTIDIIMIILNKYRDNFNQELTLI